MKVFNPFPLKKQNEYVIWKEKKRIPNVIVWISWTTLSPIRYLNVLCVPCQERVRLTCGTRPGNSVLTVTCPELTVRNSGRTDINGCIPDTYRMLNAREPNKPHTNA